MAGRLPKEIVCILAVAFFAANCSSAPRPVAEESVANPTVAESTTVATAGPESTPTATPLVVPEVALDTTPAPVFLLAPEDEWVIVEHYSGSDAGSSGRQTQSIWVWRVDGQLVMLQSGSGYGSVSAASPADATIEHRHNRSVLAWKPDQKQLALTGFDIDDAALVALADQLSFDGESWNLPSATILIDEPGPAPRARPSDRVQANFAPIENGSADLAATIIGLSETAPPGSVYRQLIGWSELGDVSEITIAGNQGVLVEGRGEPGDLGPSGSWAAVEVAGRVFNWSTTFLGAADHDQLEALLAAMQPATEVEWRAAIEASDTEVAKAVDAVGLDSDQVAPPAELPRFVLPEGWSIEWVTDKGIWSPEQRAREIAFATATRPAELADSWPVSTRAQGFSFSSVEDRANDLVVAVIVNTSVFDNGSGIPEQPTNYTPIELGDLQGSAHEGSAELYAENLGVFIRGSTLDHEELLAFVQALSPRNGDPTQGFTITDDRYVQVFEQTGNEQFGESVRQPISKWAMAWDHDDSAAKARISARLISFVDLQQRLTYGRGTGAAEQTIAGSIDDPFITGEAGRGSFFWHYDTDSEVLIEVSVTRPVVSARDLFASLISIELDAWTELAAPVNTKPR